MIRAYYASRTLSRLTVYWKHVTVQQQRFFCNHQLVVADSDMKDVFSTIINASMKPVPASLSSHLNQLSQSLLDGPTAAVQAWEEPLLVMRLMELEECGVEEVEEQARMCLALLGQAPPYPGNGLRILSIDGGGTRGLLPIILLKYLEELCGQPVHTLFDFVCGTSTGSLLAAMLCLEKLSAEECRSVYLTLSCEVFKMNNLLGMSQLFINHAFYDSKLLQKHIRQFKSVSLPIYKSSSYRGVPRLCFVATVANQPVVAPYLFCNYKHRPSKLRERRSNYQQKCDIECWEAIMASTAAPGFFEEVKLGPYVFMDGGILTNNPCAVAIHEARLLWGSSVPIQTVVSLGTGLKYKSDNHQPTQENITSTSLKEKIIKVVGGATDTETVHTILNDVYNPSTYFRFQPELTEDIGIDESNPEKLSLLCKDAELFIAEHKETLEAAANSLLGRKRPHQKVQAWLTLNWDKIIHSFQYNSRKFRDKF